MDMDGLVHDDADGDHAAGDGVAGESDTHKGAGGLGLIGIDDVLVGRGVDTLDGEADDSRPNDAAPVRDFCIRGPSHKKQRDR